MKPRELEKVDHKGIDYLFNKIMDSKWDQTSR
jgi:hypothetical protein